jgi:aspartyl protease family protein
MRDDQFFEPERGSGMMVWAVRQLVVWLIGGLAVYFLIANRAAVLPEMDAVKPAGASAPASVQPADAAYANSLTLRAGRDGHVYTEVSVNGAAIRMIVDTGATDVVLTMHDAAAAGLAVSQLAFTGHSNTANGVTRVAPVTLRTVRIGQLEIADIRAAVVEHLDVSLLGQTFLSRLDSYEMRDGVLTLSWR